MLVIKSTVLYLLVETEPNNANIDMQAVAAKKSLRG
jgi:hypothetical protein